jgi:hypothetical protein
MLVFKQSFTIFKACCSIVLMIFLRIFCENAPRPAGKFFQLVIMAGSGSAVGRTIN